MKHAIDIIKRPRITEKAALSSELLNAYVFEVSERSTKKEIEKTIKELYKVYPVKVNIIRLPAKKVFSKGKKGMTSRIKKAVVYIKKGEKIEIT